MIGSRGRSKASAVLGAVVVALFSLGLAGDLGVTPSLSEALPALHSQAKRSSSAIAVTADGALLLVVNPDSASVTLVETAGRTVLAEVPVGIDPRTVTVDDVGTRAYVANRGSDSISVIDLVAHEVVDEVTVGDRPYGVVLDPDGKRLYVAEQGIDRLSVLDANTLEPLAALPMADRPSGLAIDDEGRTLYVTHLLTNTVSVVEIRPFSTYLPTILRQAIASALLGQARSLGYAQGAAQSFDVAQDASQSFDVAQDASRQGERALSLPSGRIFIEQSSSIRLWPDSNLVQSIVLFPDGQRAYVAHTRSNTTSRQLTFDTTVFPLVSLIDLQAQKHLVGQQIDLGTLDPPGVGLPFDAAVTPDGGELWVANAASNDVSVVDLAGRRLAAHVEVGDNPRGIVLSPDGGTAYVNNTLAGTVSVIDTTTYAVTEVVTVTSIPLPPTLLNGKRLFHSSDDPRMSRAQWISCNTCHFEGEHDGRTWFFGFAGLRNTTSLLGMVETYPLRWSGEWDESADSEFANRKENIGSGLIAGDMNCTGSPPDCLGPLHAPNQGLSYDLDCLAAFIDSLLVPKSPSHAHGEPLSEAERRGQAILADPALGCVYCHPPPLYTDLQMHDVGTSTGLPDERIGPSYDTPTLRGLYDSAPYFHDGSAATLYETLTRPSPGSEHDVRALLTDDEIQDLIAFLLALPFGK